MKWKGEMLCRESFLMVVCLLGTLLLLYPVGLVFAKADNDWIVTLRQSPGTRAQVAGGWTRDGMPIEHPGGFYTLTCNGTVSSKRIAKEDLATEPNDADYDIKIWWPGEVDPEEHDFERIDAPGSKTYTHNSPTYEVTFEVSQAPVPSVSDFGMVILILLLSGLGTSVLLLERKKIVRPR